MMTMAAGDQNLDCDLSLSSSLDLSLSIDLVQAKAGQKLKLVQAKLAKNNCMAGFLNILSCILLIRLFSYI